MKSYRAQLSAQRNDFKKWLRANAPEGQGHRRVRHLAERRRRASSTATRSPRSRPRRWCKRAQYQGLYHPTHDDPDLALINALRGLGAAGGAGRRRRRREGRRSSTPASTSTHPCFNDAGYPAQTQLGDHNVHQQQGDRRQGLQQQDSEPRLHAPRPSRTHGTHVAGTVACNYDTPATVNGVAIPTTSPASRRARCSATTTSSRATSRTRAPRTS